MRKLNILGALVLAALIMPVTSAVAQTHAGDLWIAVSGAGQLKLSPHGYPAGEAVTVLGPASGLIHGWSYSSPGFDDIENDDVENDAYPLDAGANIWVEIVAIDPAFLIWKPGLTGFIDEPGERIELGTTPNDIHVHPVWHIN